MPGRVPASFAVPRLFSDYGYASIAQQLLDLATKRPDLASLSTTQALYGLPTAGRCTNADRSQSACLNYVLEITNRTSKLSAPARPEVFISGALHGDERVGIITAIELCRWLIERYEFDPWVRRLVDSRVVIVMPMTNAIGASLKQRSELGIDPNRDFPYDQNPASCMQTIAARSVNEIYRSRLLQLVVTFHGGMQAIAYNWGSFNHYQGTPRRSPDDTSQREIAEQMSRFAGSGNVWSNTNYPVQTMNDLVYPVHGGMEDWGYAASWDRSLVHPCTPQTYGGYASDRTSYADGMAQAFTVLVETSDNKAPPASTYGGEEGVYNPGSPADGHVPRNMRLALAGIDLVQPYIKAWFSASGGFEQSVLPSPVCIPLGWEVWGAIRVEEAVPVWRRGANDTWRECTKSQVQAGDGVWGASSSALSPHVFSGCAILPQGQAGRLQLAIRARVDTSWARAPTSEYMPHKPPQSTLAKTRGASSFHIENHGHQADGHAFWFSTPLELSAQTKVGDALYSIANATIPCCCHPSPPPVHPSLLLSVCR